VQDTVTAAYYARFLPLEPGRMFDMRVANNESNYELFLKVRQKERRSSMGKVRDVYQFQPYAKYKGEQVRAGRLSGYVSADPRREPVFIVIKAPIFTSVTAFLVRAERQ
jgi:hypothetical protein